MTPRDLTFVLGGARSGKSAHAERLAAAGGRPVTYIATARVADDEFAERVAHHRARRPADWALVEAPVELARAIAQLDDPNACVLVDCLTLWLTNLLCPADGQGVDDALGDARVAELEAALRATRAQVIVVSNEIGFGVVPLGAETRRFVDTLGRVNQRIAALATRVTLCVAGLPVTVKHEGDPRC
ncbi:bifunctional adenosylcobinamide kinase/adenosylcobinamide-phosphate guanylyltransferase [Burkholderia oklahomensis]|uniref:bifunctional adenosylcobinamide kinase/adenosylcobinamide-phosphate guanylyltransferase n=1 Tax=Burkholderia oklahomensis TaxID=342113 RepID=UPI00016A7C06|nr:bifunctional adenosylcobinamide kinase/adenosylcobinamide-phosphate guanylyltransferase [Burkholderia oklahomensis]AJX31610.1 cobinamide kinase / cobinamide phosphate guanyltransferase family protein [Burkholderia oklahomensis C6786]AOI46767.1 adenosylcobinamide kinase/adenosylcobinamide phosphate guanyltransferase [Burkholderia oklahomensis C6786]KUY62943.1 adenosylcobinamide kinase/adenosylcobinamide phosphate guanyltransferase [Burkholderia oklahomensis C6786]MBI0360590.1 bifunctional ade